MILGKYNQAKTITFDLVAPDGVDLIINATFAAGDLKIMKDEGVEANTANLPTDEGTGYSLVLTAAEMSAARIRIYIIDQTATKIWLDTSLGLETYGNASAEHAFDLDTAAETMRGTDNALLAASINLTAGAVDTVTDVTNQVTADMTAISGDTVAADNLESQYDTTGLTGDTFPATQLQLGNIVSVGAATNTPAESYTLTTGTQSANLYTDTAPLDGTSHQHTDAAGVMELYYQFDVGTHGVPTSVTAAEYLVGGNDTLQVYAYNWVGTSWDQIGTLSGGGATIASHTHPLYSSHVGTGANLGKVRIQYETPSGLTSAILAIDQIYVSYATIVEAAHIDGTINDVSPTTISFDTDLTQADGFWNDALLTMESTALDGQTRAISAYLNASGNITLDEAMTSAPVNGDSFRITFSHVHPITQIQAGLATETKQDAQDLIITEARLAELDAANLPADIATVNTNIGNLNDPTAAAVAAAVAAYDMGNGRTIEEALAFLRNKWTIIGGTLTVYDTDDTTVLWTSAMTQTAGNPVSASDPV